MKKLLRGKGGFTLVELLVVIAVLAVLASIAVPNIGKIVGSGTTEANATELQLVQTAMDLYMADNGVAAGSVPAQAIATSDLSTSTPALYPDYSRVQTTRCTYTWDAQGAVTQAGC